MRLLILLLTLTFGLTLPAAAATIKATGRAQIDNGDVDSARAQAINRATEQASMMALAQIAVTQTVRDGILEIDNLRVSTQTTLGAVELISEKRSANQLEVLISAEVNAVEGCADESQATAYRKPLALTQWTLARPSEANLGRLQGLSTLLPGYLIAALEQRAHLKLLDARQQRLPTYNELSPNAAVQRAQDAAHLNTQYLFSATIDSLAMAQATSDTPNLITDLAERSGLKQPKNQRLFKLTADLIDAKSGDILQRYRLETTDRWTASPQTTQPISLGKFAEEPFGQAVLSELDGLADSLAKSLACQPLQATIVAASGTTVWIDRGSDAGLNAGDRLSVARQIQMYDAMMQPITSTEPTSINLVIEKTEFSRAQGRLSQSSDIAGIQPGDIALGY